jgi:hypothetical protein
MDAILAVLSREVAQLLGRASGPLHFRLLLMPIVVTVLGIRAGLKDAREGQPPFLWTMLTDPGERRRLFRSELKDTGRIFVIALVLDTTYQLVVLRWFYPVQLLIVAVACAIVPYALVRGPVTRLAGALSKRRKAKENGRG